MSNKTADTIEAIFIAILSVTLLGLALMVAIACLSTVVGGVHIMSGVVLYALIVIFWTHDDMVRDDM